MSQSVEISSENVVGVEVGSQEIESVKTNKNADIIQIPVELESEAVSETGGDVSVAEDDRTLEQVADIAVDVNQEPASKQSIHRASLDDVLDLTSESTEPPSVSERDKDRTTSVTGTIVLPAEIASSTAQKSSSLAETLSKAESITEKEVQSSQRKTALTSYTASDGLIEIPVQIEPTATEESVAPAAVEAVPAPSEEVFRQIPIEEEKPGLIEVPIEEVPYRTGVEEEPKEKDIDSRSVPVEYTEEPSGLSAEPPEPRKRLEYERKPEPPREERVSRKKSRKEVLEEVQHALAVEILEKGSLAPPPKPNHVTYASWAPPRIHAPSYTPYSSLIAPEPKYRNRYTVAYHYTPPAMTRLNEFDDYVKIGAYGQDLWSTDRALQRSRSLDRRPPGACQRTYVGPSPIGRRAQLSAASYSAPPSRSSSATNLMDYVNATRFELKRSASRNAVGADEQGYVRTDYGRVVPSSESVSQPWTVYEKLATQTENYLRRLHEPYEATTPSYYRTYTGRPYSPYCALPLRQDRVYHYFDRLSEEEWAQPRLERAYESRLNQFMIDIYRDRDSRSRAHRDASYAAFAGASPFSRRFETFPARPYYSSYPQYGLPQRSCFRPDFVAQPISLSPAFITRNRYNY